MKGTAFIAAWLGISLGQTACQPSEKRGQHKIDMEKFEWLPGLNASLNYPITVHSGSFLTKDGIVGIPNGGILEEGWGDDGMTMGDGRKLKTAPTKFRITFFSYIENKFYKCENDLPFDTMQALFKTGFIYSGSRKWETYNSVIIGMAPGGVVVVWMGGSNRQVEIERYQAKEIELDWNIFNPNTILDRNVFVNNVISRRPETDKILRESRVQFGLWDKYRIRHHWKARVDLPSGYKLFNKYLSMYNAEHFFLWGDYLDEAGLEKKAVPKEVLLRWYEGEDRYAAEFYFDEKEVFKAFEEIYRKDPEQEAELLFRYDVDSRAFTVLLRGKTEEIEIEKGRRKPYKMSKPKPKVE